MSDPPTTAEPTRPGAPERARGSTARRRIPGRAFAIGLGLFLVVGTAVFTYLARQAQRTREAAFEQMQHDGVIVPPRE